MAQLRLDYCDTEAARYSVRRWHYSRSLPAGKTVKIGVWENEIFKGCILYGSGANRHLSRPFGLAPTAACELTRVALAPGRVHPTSRCLAISLKMLRRQSPGLQLVVSYADSKEGHFGTLYQATNWLFLGGSSQPYLKVKGRIEHPRSLHARYGRGGQQIAWLRANIDPNARRVEMPDKFKYVYAFSGLLRKKLEAIALPYPKRGRSDTSDTPGLQPGEGGATPTRPLHSASAAP